MKNNGSMDETTLLADLKLQRLTAEHIKRIDEMLEEVGEYGEVHIIVQKGKLRYINKVESFALRDKDEKD